VTCRRPGCRRRRWDRRRAADSQWSTPVRR
jgi:hypothetical protein